jgi:mevalonate kinase
MVFISFNQSINRIKILIKIFQYNNKNTCLQSLVQVNQGLLYALSVSHPSLDAICATAARHGLHAKLTGAGGGGNAFVLLPPDLSQTKLQELQEELKSQGFYSSEETLFGPGVKTEP